MRSTRCDGLSDKGPYRAGASCYGNGVEGNYYLTLGLRHRLPEPFSNRNRVGPTNVLEGVSAPGTVKSNA
jgi:hypothetical protein